MQTQRLIRIFSLAAGNSTPRFSLIGGLSNNFSSNSSIYDDAQTPYYTAKDIEFAPNRAKDVQQNNVEETYFHESNEECTEKTSALQQSDEEHTIAYRADSSVNLHSVMQSNVPDPFTTPDKAPTHLNMPGGSSTRNYKYVSDQMQTAHHSRQ